MNALISISTFCLSVLLVQHVSAVRGHGQQGAVDMDRLWSRLNFMENVLDELYTKVDALQTALDHHTRAVAFSARLDGRRPQHLNSTDALILPKVLVNEGGGYNNVTGNFTAPVTGIYYFSAMTASAESGLSATLWLRSTSSSSGDFLFRSYSHTSKAEGGKQTSSLQGTVVLRQGEKVWLQSDDYESFFEAARGTVFNGFLISAN